MTNNASNLPLGICSCSSPVPPVPPPLSKVGGHVPLLDIWRRRLCFRFRFDLLIITGIEILHRLTKFEFYSCNLSRDVQGVRKFLK